MGGDEGSRVAHMDPLVHRGAADVHADGSGLRGSSTASASACRRGAPADRDPPALLTPSHAGHVLLHRRSKYRENGRKELRRAQSTLRSSADSKRARLAADGFQLAEDGTRIVQMKDGRAPALGNSRNRRSVGRASVGSWTSPARGPSAHTRGPRPASARRRARAPLQLRFGSSGKLVVRHLCDRVDRESAKAGQIEVTSCSGRSSSSRYARTARAGNPSSLRTHGGAPVPLRELLPVRAQHETVVQHLRQLAADRACDSLLELEIGPVVVPADDMGDFDSRSSTTEAS